MDVPFPDLYWTPLIQASKTNIYLATESGLNPSWPRDDYFLPIKRNFISMFPLNTLSFEFKWKLKFSFH